MSQLLYYLLIKPLSLLPLGVLYRLSDLAFVLLYYVARYRRRVVLTNLRNSFPEKSPAEIERIARRFFRHFCDLMVESIRIFSISGEEAIRRCRVVNPEVFAPYAERGQSVVAVGGHYANWEMAAVGFNQQIPHWVLGIYSPLKNKFIDDKIQESRTTFGTGLINRRHVKQFFEEHKDRLTCVFFIGDQSPSSSEMKQYWTTWLNQETGVVLGTEKYAREYNQPVLYTRLRKVKRGHYEAFFIPIEDHPREAEPFSITEKHARLLEAEIRREPAYWLWTHRRWKHRRKAELIG